MAAPNKKDISLGDDAPNPDVTRGAAPQMAYKGHADMLQMNPVSGKQAVQSKTHTQFGGDTQQIMTLIPDTVQSKNANYSKIEVVQQQEPISTAIQYNEVSTRLVQGIDCQTALQQLSNVLSAYSQEIEFHVDPIDSTKVNAPAEITDGVVFVDNYHAVHFKVYLFHDPETDGVRMEFRRNSGDALAAAKFLGEINTAFNLSTVTKRGSTGNLLKDAVIAATKQAVRDSLSKSSLSHDIEMATASGSGSNVEPMEQDGNTDGNTLIALDTNFDGLELKMNEEQAERMMIHEALMADDVVGDLDESAENYLFSKLVENGAISNNIVDHEMLCGALMQRQTLLHKDVAVVRASLLVLRNLVDTHFKMMANAKCLNVVNEVMKGARYGLTRKYAAYFLSALAAMEGDWNLDDKVKASLKGQLKGVEEEMKKMGQNAKGSRGTGAIDFAAGTDFGAIWNKL